MFDIFFFDVNLVMFFFRYPIHFSKLCVSGIVLHLMQARVSEFFPCYMMILYIFVSASITTKMIGVKKIRKTTTIHTQKKSML